jgi:hypothetical protein
MRLLFVLLCVQAAALGWADPPSKESSRLCIGLETEKAAKFQQNGCRAREAGGIQPIKKVRNVGQFPNCF